MTEIENRRKQKGYTQEYMAKEIEVSIGCYNMYENNQRKIPNKKAEKITKVLNCEMEDIFIPSSFTASEKTVKEAI